MTFNPFTPIAAGQPAYPNVGVPLATLPGEWATNGGSNNVAQALEATLAQAAQTTAISHLGIWMANPGITAGAGINGLAIYSEAATLLGQTADMTAAFAAANGQMVIAPTTASVPITAGLNYYLAFLHNFTGTPPQLPFCSPPPGIFPPINNHYPHVFILSQTSFPASFVPSSAGLNGVHWYYEIAY